MGYLGHLVEAKLASLYKVTGELPSISRPMYETIHTDCPSVPRNRLKPGVRTSTKPNIFHSARAAGRITAAAAYYWISELYNRSPYNPIDDREVDNASLSIQHGRFIPRMNSRILTIRNGRMLVQRFNPDYMLVHPMGMDHAGETHGANSSEYRNQAVRQDRWLATYLTDWMKRGYNILFTAGPRYKCGWYAWRHYSRCARGSAFISSSLRRSDWVIQEQTVSQLQIAPTICKLLELEIPETMKAAPLVRPCLTGIKNLPEKLNAKNSLH